MSNAPKTGSSRIPTFSSRIPQISRPAVTPVATPSSTNPVTPNDINRKVRVGEKEGVLKYLGNVHFAPGVWCGVELISTTGKNDGTVSGVRYFTCPPLKGLMAPVAKVALLIEGSCESLNDEPSGPFSMLFIDQERTNTDNLTFVKQNDEEQDLSNTSGDANVTVISVNKSYAKNLPPLQLNHNLNETVTREANATYNADRRRTHDVNTETANTTYAASLRRVENEATSKKRTNESFVITKCKNTTITKSDNDITFDVKKLIADESALELTYLPINKSCEDLLNESSIEVKRRRTSNPKNHHKFESQVLRSIPQNIDLTSSLPHLRFSNSSSNSPQFANLKQGNSSTPLKQEFADDLCRKLRLNIAANSTQRNLDEDSNKRDSLDCEESLGILTPDQMVDSIHTRSPSLERASKLFSDLSSPKDSSLGLIGSEGPLPKSCSAKSSDHKENLLSPNVASVTNDFSLGIIDDQMMNFAWTRCEETPSPEELPLDTTPIVETEPKTENTETVPKSEPTKSKTTSSIITSITSITSLDTGYQGDGEMSRPASRGAENSPLSRRPIPRPQPRRPDPMTDSDFYTESDADNHEEGHLRGDRKAQVIDGTLYGVDPQAAADIYVNNRENMDSSGIFTDIENNTKNEDECEHETHSANRTIQVSPSDSSKTISENSQDNLKEILETTTKRIEREPDKTIDNPKKRNAPSPGISSSSSISSPRHKNKDDSSAKKYKMPKRDVASKVKSMRAETCQNEQKIVAKKPVGRWDAVMNKISKNDHNKNNLKDIKSKVFSSVNLSPGNGQRTISDARKPNARPTGIQNNKSRRIRPRSTVGALNSHQPASNVGSSIHSSLSDLSSTATTQSRKTPGSGKKRDAIQVTQVLTAQKITPKSLQNSAENKKNASNLHSSSSANEPKSRRAITFPKDKKPSTAKECGKSAAKGAGRASPQLRGTAGRPHQPSPRRPPLQPPPRVAEALAVLVHHLVFNVEAYKVPILKKEVQKFRSEAEEVRLLCQQLEETLVTEKSRQAKTVEDERDKFERKIVELVEKHQEEIAHITAQHAESEKQLRIQKENEHQYICQQHEDQLATLKREFEKLQKTHEEALDILREENDSIMEQIDEKRDEAEKAVHESMKLKKDYESKETKLHERIDLLNIKNNKLAEQLKRLEKESQEKFNSLLEENLRLREENNRLLSYGDDKAVGVQEVQSLRAVLDLKQTEVSELRRTLGEVTQKLEILEGAEEKAAVLQARCEDLQHQLLRKSEHEQVLAQENQKLQESFKEEINQKKRLSQHNEELQWKLKQSKEIMNKVMEQTESTTFSRSLISSSFNERHNLTKNNLERALSFRECMYSDKSPINLDTCQSSRKSRNSIKFDTDDISPPTSPKIKGVVEKSDSVSYVLDLDESPDVVASRIVRRSFRNTTPPKSTPTKSPSNKRARIRNPLSLSASSSAIMMSSRDDMDESSPRNGSYDRDVFIWNSTPKVENNGSTKLNDNLDLDEDNEDEIELPALPSELDKSNGCLALPSPKHLAGDSMVSESNSEDESTSSSQL